VLIILAIFAISESYQMKLAKREKPIDAVITWVDGNDEAFREKLNQYSENKIDWSNKKETIRFNSIEEVGVVIDSIVKFAPFIRNIFLVTDNQTPKCFNALVKKNSEKSVNIELIDHSIIFKDYEQYLPTFNSCSIGTMLYRIPNLAEQFVFFNDDTFLMRETKPEDFFVNGLPVVRGRWSKYYENQILRNIYKKTVGFIKKKKVENVAGYKLAQQKSAKLLGLKQYVRRDHTPVAIRKSTVASFFDTHNSLFQNNIKHRFRHADQFIISSLSNHIEIKNNSYVLKKDFQLVYFQSYTNILMLRKKLLEFELNKSKLFMCCQSLEIASPQVIDMFFAWFSKRFDK